MENVTHLAITSIPVQTWKEVYDETNAFKEGTIFPELNKPFYVTVQDDKLNQKEKADSMKMAPREKQLLQIQKISFVADDLRLYLDTHPEDKKGLELFKDILKKRKTLLKEFALQFYPLTVDCMADIYEENPDSACYCWVEGPIPWEGGMC